MGQGDLIEIYRAAAETRARRRRMSTRRRLLSKECSEEPAGMFQPAESNAEWRAPRRSRAILIMESGRGTVGVKMCFSTRKDGMLRAVSALEIAKQRSESKQKEDV